MPEKKREEPPSYLYVNPADFRDFTKYAEFADRMTLMARKGNKKVHYTPYVNNETQHGSHIVCVLN